MPQSSPQGDSHTRRVRLVVILTSYASIVFGVPWMAFFALDGHTLIALADGVVVVAGVMAVLMARRNQLRTASIVLVSSLYLRMVGMAVFFDIPSAQIPRSIHHFFIPLAVATYLMLKHENVWLRRGMAWTCLLTVVFFSASDFAIVTALAVSDSIRGPGTWLNNACAMLLLYLLLYIFVADLDRLENNLHRLRRAWVKLVHRMTPRVLDRPLARFGNSIPPTIPVSQKSIAAEGTQNWHHSQASRVLLLVQASSTLMVVLGGLFAAFFAVMGAWSQVYFQGALMLLGVALAIVGGSQPPVQPPGPGNSPGVTRRGWQSLANIALVACLILFSLATSLVVDIPAPGMPRSVHYWFLPLALGAYFLLRQEAAWIQNLLPLVCLLAFVGLASSTWGIYTDYSLAPEERPSPWLVASAALGGLYAYVFILVGDIKKLQNTLQTLLQRSLPQFLVRKRAR